MAEPKLLDISESPTPDITPSEPPTISGKAEWDALAPGAEYVADGVKYRKPYVVGGSDPRAIAESYRDVPEGAVFVDPAGVRRRKPTYEGVDLGSQILIDMAHERPEQVEAILRDAYKGGTVAREPLTGEIYVEKDGKRYKPGRGSFAQRAAASTVTAAAPALGGGLGATLGGTAGSIVPVAGTAAGAVAGAGLGVAAGEAFNQSVLVMAGYPEKTKDQLLDIATGGVYGMAGQAGGMTAGAAIRAAPAVLKEAGRRSSGLARYLLGAQPEESLAASALRRKAAELGINLKMRPSAYLTEAPYLKTVVEQFDPVFREQKVLEQSAEAYYNSEVSRILRGMGVPVPKTPWTDASQPIALQPFGQQMIDSATKRLAARDAELNRAIEAARAQLRAKVDLDPRARDAALQSLVSFEAQARAAAQEVIDLQFQSIDADIANAARLSDANGNPTTLARLANDKVNAARQSFQIRARTLYGKYDQVSGGITPDATDVALQAHELLAQLPEDFEKSYPAIIKQLSEIVGGPNTTPPTLGQLHMLRSMLRQDIDYNDLTPGIREGALKKMVNSLNDVLKAGPDAPAEEQAAAALLRSADQFYAENAPKFRSQSLRWTARLMEAGVPVDAETVAARFLKPSQSEEIAMVRGVMGEAGWKAVLAADTRRMLNASKTLIPGEIDGRLFAAQVEDRVRNGILDVAYDKELADTLRGQARSILEMQGKIPMVAREGDTVNVLMRRADSLAREAKQLAEADPLGVLNKEMKEFEREVGKIRGLARRMRADNPLDFLDNGSMGAIAAAKKVLNNPDLIIQVARQYGDKSPEMEMLRQVYAQRLLQRTLRFTPKLHEEFTEKMPPEVARLLFGKSFADLQQLAKDMQFLLPYGDADFGGSLAAKSRVLEPLPKLPFGAHELVSKLPGANYLARQILGWYYKTITNALTSPVFYDYIFAGLRSGNPSMRELVRREWREQFQKWALEKYGPRGAFAAGVLESARTPEPPRPDPGAMPADKPWRSIYQEQTQR